MKRRIRPAVAVTLSLGIAAFPTDGKNMDVLLERADKALYRAKETGRNQTVLATDPEDSQKRPTTAQLFPKLVGT